MNTAQKVALKLNGTLKKWTVTVLLRDGRTVEVQTDEEPRIRFDDTSRSTWLRFGYGESNGVAIDTVAAYTSVANDTPQTEQPQAVL